MYDNKSEDEKYSIEDLVEITKILRAPNGCPWDREQTHQSIRRDLIEECYELAETIDDNDSEHMKEELGDVLFQVVFHSVLEEESKNFTFDDVIDGITRKMIKRHPHVFGNIEVKTSEDVLQNWDKIKRESSKSDDIKSYLNEVSHALPSLMRAQKIIERCQRYGQNCTLEKDEINCFDEMNAEDVGKLMFNLVKYCVKNSIDPEKALSDYSTEFIDNI
jgi:tetrapyrrole methylase family protein/MazG family protein